MAELCEHVIRVPVKWTSRDNWIRFNLVIILVPKKSDTAIKKLLKEIFLRWKGSLFTDIERCFYKRDRGKRGHRSETAEGQTEKGIWYLLELCQLMSCGPKTMLGLDRTGPSDRRTGALCAKGWSLDLWFSQSPHSFFQLELGCSVRPCTKAKSWTPVACVPRLCAWPAVFREGGRCSFTPMPRLLWSKQSQGHTALINITITAINRICPVFCICHAFEFYVLYSQMTSRKHSYYYRV